MELLHPVWLVLSIPAALSLWLWRAPARGLTFLRAAGYGLVILALCGVAVYLPSRAGVVVVVADRSLSMPPDGPTRQSEVVALLEKSLPADDRLAVVSFAQNAVVDKSPFENSFSGFAHQIDHNGSRLADALDLALGLIGPDQPSRILVLSDGHNTGRSVAGSAARAAARQIAIDFRLLQRPAGSDLAIERVETPRRVAPGQSYLLHAFVRSPIGQEIRYELRRQGERLTAGSSPVSAGLTRLTFRDRAGRGQTRQYLLRLQTDLNDPIPENNQARILVGIEGTRPLLAATLSPEQSGLLRLLRQGQLEIEGVDPQAFSWTLDGLSGYAGVLLEDVPAETIGTAGMELLAAWVQQTGSGLLVTGGKNSFGPGGYYNSPLDPILPVSMELRQEHRDFRLALVIALDRSGSMSMAAGAGRTKMDLANLASVEVLELLSPNDELGVLAVDSSPHVISPCRPIRDQGNLRNDILRIEPGGGGIFVYTALVEAARMVSQAQAGTRHILLFADAADAEEPGSYEELLDACRQDGVTVSVIGLGKPTDADAEFLQDVARRGEGRIFFTEDAQDLPRLFAQDTFVVARSTFIEEPTEFRFLPGMQSLAETIP
ncbi:MAG: VWA domain-containing protein, partial [Sedimentisphaerales bacterium]|nr:VWA domain-containing protein [Sedimentisphaerales bacterium]